MQTKNFTKTLAATAVLAVAALGATPLAQAGTGTPQNGVDIIAILKHPDSAGTPQKQTNIIAILKREHAGSLKREHRAAPPWEA